jgi:hypothetical protein
MKRALKAIAVLAALTSVAFADNSVTTPDGSGGDAKDVKKTIEDQGIYVETAKPGITLSGYVDAGYTYGFAGDNTGGATQRLQSGGTLYGDNKPGSNFGLNAFKLALEKPLSTKNEYSAGFRTDLIFGQDASIIDGNANTGSTDGTANLLVEQAFVDFNLPVGNGIQFKVGKFVTPLGYEVVERPSNPDITYGDLYADMIPADHTGVLASYKVNDIIDVKAGVVDGWNTATGTTSTALGNAAGTDGVGLLGTLNVTAPGGNANIQQGVYVGFNPASEGTATAQAALTNPAGATASNQALWVYDVWGQWKPKFNANLTLGFESDIGQYATSGSPVVGVDNESTWTGAALYATYQFTKIFALSGRGEWMHSDDGQKFGATSTQFTGGSEDVYETTLTATITAWENLLLRAEYRVDFGSYTEAVGGPVTTVASQGGPAQLIDLEAVYSF